MENQPHFHVRFSATFTGYYCSSQGIFLRALFKSFRWTQFTLSERTNILSSLERERRKCFLTSFGRQTSAKKSESVSLCRSPSVCFHANGKESVQNTIEYNTKHSLLSVVFWRAMQFAIIGKKTDPVKRKDPVLVRNRLFFTTTVFVFAEECRPHNFEEWSFRFSSALLEAFWLAALWFVTFALSEPSAEGWASNQYQSRTAIYCRLGRLLLRQQQGIINQVSLEATLMDVSAFDGSFFLPPGRKTQWKFYQRNSSGAGKTLLVSVTSHLCPISLSFLTNPLTSCSITPLASYTKFLLDKLLYFYNRSINIL